MRNGFSAIGLHKPKDIANIGGVIRACQAYDASLVAISGERINGEAINHATNTGKGHRHFPVLRGDLKSLIPFGSVPVGVDLVDGAITLPEFNHPKQAFYIFGPEDGTLGKEILDWCAFKIMVPTSICMNLAATVNVVLYDRLSKELSKRMQIAA